MLLRSWYAYEQSDIIMKTDFQVTFNMFDEMGAFQSFDSSKLRLSDESPNVPFPKFHCHVVFINTDIEFLF